MMLAAVLVGRPATTRSRGFEHGYNVTRLQMSGESTQGSTLSDRRLAQWKIVYVSETIVSSCVVAWTFSVIVHIYIVERPWLNSDWWISAEICVMQRVSRFWAFYQRNVATIQQWLWKLKSAQECDKETQCQVVIKNIKIWDGRLAGTDARVSVLARIDKTLDCIREGHGAVKESQHRQGARLWARHGFEHLEVVMGSVEPVGSRNSLQYIFSEHAILLL